MRAIGPCAHPCFRPRAGALRTAGVGSLGFFEAEFHGASVDEVTWIASGAERATASSTRRDARCAADLHRHMVALVDGVEDVADPAASPEPRHAARFLSRTLRTSQKPRNTQAGGILSTP